MCSCHRLRRKDGIDGVCRESGVIGILVVQWCSGSFCDLEA